MLILYNILLHTILLIMLPVLPAIWLFSKKRRQNLLQRLGFNHGFTRKEEGTRRMWIHALSVGEVKSALPLVTALRQKYPDWSIVFTSTTVTGQKMARELYRSRPPLADQTGYFPFDFPFAVKAITRGIGPDRVILVETDLWPNFIHFLKKSSIPVILVNARLSRRSFKGYRMLRHLFLPVLANLSRIFVQTDQDRERYAALGLPGKKISVAGNIKFDQPASPGRTVPATDAGHRLKLSDHDLMWIAGSTHEGEEQIIGRVFARLKKRHPALKLILAPRDPGRCPAVLSLLNQQELSPRLFTRPGHDPESADIILVDVMGVLAGLYAICDIAFIGGSLVPGGGHNPLEAAACGIPVLFGPGMDDFSLIAQQMAQNKAAFMVADHNELYRQTNRLLADSALRHDMGTNALEFFNSRRGAVANILEQLEESCRE